MMNGMMDGTMGGMGLWIIIGGLIVVVLIVAVFKLLQRK